MIDSATISYDSPQDWHDAEETHYLLVTKQWRLECGATEDSFVAKVLVCSSSLQTLVKYTASQALGGRFSSSETLLCTKWVHDKLGFNLITLPVFLLSHTIISNDGLLQVAFGNIQAADSSIFKAAAPALRGPIPRLARELLIDSINILMQAEESSKSGGSREIMFSGELLGALALGFDGEIGNFILRQESSASPQASFTWQLPPAGFEMKQDQRAIALRLAKLVMVFLRTAYFSNL